jgi:hypothetical protein
MREFPNGSQSDFRRTRPVEERAQTIECHLLHAFLLRGGNPSQAACEVIRDVDRHRVPRYYSLDTRSALHQKHALENLTAAPDKRLCRFARRINRLVRATVAEPAFKACMDECPFPTLADAYEISTR